MTRDVSVQDLRLRSASVVEKRDIFKELPFAPAKGRESRESD